MDGVAGIDDILDDQDVLAFDRPAHIHDEPDCAATHAAVLITRDRNEFDVARDAEAAR